MTKRTMIPARELPQLLRHNPDTGVMIWRTRSPVQFAHCKRPAQACAAWNARHAGKRAINSISVEGYLQGTVGGAGTNAHRVMWAMCTGAWASGDIDHINGVRTDNRIDNLRAVTRSENLRNSALSRGNTSGVTGVSWDTAMSKWRADITVNSKAINLGRFRAKSDAISARKAAEIKYGFHENHGMTADKRMMTT